MFRPLVHAVGRAAGAAMLPSVGLCLNASKAESALDRRWRRYARERPASRKARRKVEIVPFEKGTLLGGRPASGPSPQYRLCWPALGNCGRARIFASRIPATPSAADQACVKVRSRGSESSVDDLSTWRGVVSGRAVITLRSVQTRPHCLGDSCASVCVTRFARRGEGERASERASERDPIQSIAPDHHHTSSYARVVAPIGWSVRLGRSVRGLLLLLSPRPQQAQTPERLCVSPRCRSHSGLSLARAPLVVLVDVSGPSRAVEGGEKNAEDVRFGWFVVVGGAGAASAHFGG